MCSLGATLVCAEHYGILLCPCCRVAAPPGYYIHPLLAGAAAAAASRQREAATAVLLATTPLLPIVTTVVGDEIFMSLESLRSSGTRPPTTPRNSASKGCP